jgi:hypothetical protein
MLKEGYLFQPEFAFAEFSIKLVCPEFSEDGLKVTLMVFAVLGVDKDVVNEDHDKLIQLFHKHFVHEVHKKAGAFVSPKGITVNSYYPYQVTNVVFWISASLILNW